MIYSRCIFIVKFGIILFTLALVLNVKTFAQNNKQVIIGSVADKITKSPLIGVSIIIVGSDPQVGTSSNEKGEYIIDQLSPNRYTLSFTYLGYQPIVIPNILVTSGKEVLLDVEMEETITTLKEVAVTSTKRGIQNEMNVVSARSFSMEEVTRYSGGMSDPARLAANFAGVITPNDQRNDLVIRGNSPQGVLWRIDGLNVPNLNHFATLGTTGGPVTALNTNVLKNSDFMTSAFSAEYGNATAGVFDIGFRKGNSSTREQTIQFGALTGLEAMIEGPINKEKGSSYLFAYRYSFTGFAQALGFSIGTAANPNYQDLSFKINGAQTKYGQFSLFGVGGYSHIDFLHNKIDSTDVFSDPTRDSYSKSTIGVIGLSHQIKLGNNSNWKTIIGGNFALSRFDQDTLTIENQAYKILEVNNQEIHYTLNSSITTKVNAKLSLKYGIIGELLSLKLFTQNREFTPNWEKSLDYSGNALLLQEYCQAKYALNNSFSIIAGLHSQQFLLNNNFSIEPRIALKYKISNMGVFTLGYGNHQQTQPLTVLFYKNYLPDGTVSNSNESLGFNKSNHYVLGYEYNFLTNWKIKLETYYQQLYNIPVTSYPSSFSLLNEGADFAPTRQGDLINNGKGTNKGVEFTLEKLFSDNYYGLITASIYDSKYIGKDGIERNTAFNGKYTFNFLAGKEFKIGKSRQDAFTLDAKVKTAGGRYYTPVDLEASRAEGKEVLAGDDLAFSERLPNYFRVDFKIGYRMNSKKRKLAQTFSLDFQNLTNQKNVFAQRFNRVNGEINTTYQNGFLPNFVYKLQF